MWRSSTRAEAEVFRWWLLGALLDVGPDYSGAMGRFGGRALMTRHRNLRECHGGDQHQ